MKNQLPKITIQQIAQTLQLALIYILFSIPLITVGAATCAAYYVSLKIINKTPEINIFSLFLKSFKLNFVQGTLMWILTSFLLYIVCLFWQNLAQNDYDSFFKLVFAVVISIIAGAFILYSFPSIARYTNKLPILIRNSAVLCIQFYTYTVSLVLKLLVIYFISAFLVKFIPPLFFAAILLLPISTIMLISSVTNKMFRELETPQPTDDAEENENHQEQDSTLQENSEETSEN